MAKAKKATARKSPAKKTATKATAKSAKSSSAKKPTTKKTTSKKPERKSAVKPAPKTTAKTPATPKPAVAAAPAPAKTAAAKAPAAKAAPIKKPAAKKSPAAASTGMPMIDTNLAAQNAAAMLINRPAPDNAGPTSQPAKESSTFKNLKEQLANPKPTGLGNLFGPAGDQKKSGGHFSSHQEKGHNQTFGGLNKSGVPRRTNG
ncbi:MAG: Histone H1-like nucleoprotein [Phycisphaerales bacterium]|nr:Histone H1-like nucleoprotein [Phycisphaerales bacterium]